MGNKKIDNDTKISATFDVAKWKNDRVSLIKGIHVEGYNQLEWEIAFNNFFYIRIQTKFLDPIGWILEKKIKKGEGFSAVALQCILILDVQVFNS